MGLGGVPEIIITLQNMLTAKKKRRENIAEYILYLWQLEDLLRALQFSPEAIYSQLVQPSGLTEAQKQETFLWYMDIVNLLREEGKEQQCRRYRLQ